MAIKTRASQTSIGWIVARESDGAISELRLVSSATTADIEATSSELLDRLFVELEEYLNGKRDRFTVRWRLDTKSSFARDVLTELTNVGFGETVSYGELASKAGHPGASRAVGNALNNNPLLILIPCHRVIAADETIGGFGAGLQCKRALHEIEGIGPLTGPRCR